MFTYNLGYTNKIKNQTRLTCKVKFDDNSIDLMKAEDDNNERESMLAL